MIYPLLCIFVFWKYDAISSLKIDNSKVLEIHYRHWQFKMGETYISIAFTIKFQEVDRITKCNGLWSFYPHRKTIWFMP
jgi:hypothetical protein